MKLFRSVVVRLLATHLLLVAIAAASALGFVFWRVGDVIDAEQQLLVEAELAALLDDYELGGLSALVENVERRSLDVTDRFAVYLVVDESGNRIAGNLIAWPSSAPLGDWTTFPLYRNDRRRLATISATSLHLPSGVRLLVGRDLEARAAFNAALRDALALALIAIAVLSLGAGWLLMRRILRRIGEIRGAAVDIMAGALESRITLRGAGDEFDQLARTLNAMLDRIAALVRDLRLATDSLAHDLRSPLARLTLALDAAQAADADPDERRRQVDCAVAEASAVLALINGLLELSRLKSGAAAEQFETLDVGRIALDVAELYAAAAEARGLALAIDAAPGLGLIGHRQLLAQALSNLVDNALHHAPAGSTVRIEARGGVDTGGPTLVVLDNGPGIPAADRERVKERFVRLDPSRRETGGGLGLAVVDAIARLHGGTLALEDNAPGLRAVIRLP